MEQNQILKNLDELNFTAIDFETANEQRNSPCSLGIVKAVGGEIVSKREILIRPKEMRFAKINVSLHGISAKVVEDALEFDDVWDQIAPEIDGQIVLAHNADFDIDVLKQTLNAYSISHPNMKYICTHKLAQEVYRDLERFRLVDLAEYFKMNFLHHNCLADAIICSEIGIRAIPVYDKKSFRFSADDLTHRISKSDSGNTSGKDFSVFEKKVLDSALLKPNLMAENKDHVFYSKRIVFTGDLKSIERHDAAAKVHNLGGDINTTISKKTDIVIVGNSAGPAKMRKIEELRAAGFNIQLIYETEFLTLIS